MRSYNCQTGTLLGANYCAVIGPEVYISLVSITSLILFFLDLKLLFSVIVVIYLISL